MKKKPHLQARNRPLVLWAVVSLWLMVPRLALGAAASDRKEVLPDVAQETGGLLEISMSKRERRAKEQIESWVRQAEVALRVNDYRSAEALYLRVLSCNIPEEQRRELLLDMARMFETSKEPAKQAAVLEKFTESFSNDEGIPQVLIKLGLLYRGLGLNRLALARFYGVLNYSLKIDSDKIDAYRKLSIRAQIEIADTYFLMAQYPEAISFYSKLRLLDLEPEDRAKAIFQTAHAQALMQNDSETIATLETFVRDYKTDEHYPEAMFLLTDAYMRVGRGAEASKTALMLLKHEETVADENEKLSIYWQKRTAEKLARDFFSQSDYSGALIIYQSMLPLGKDPGWLWPILYQMGLCYEKLGMSLKAHECYQQIVDTPDHRKKTVVADSPSLSSFLEMAQWRLGHLSWESEANENFRKLIKDIP